MSNDQSQEEEESVDEMLQHLEEAKQRELASRAAASQTWSKKAKLMRQRSDPAVLASNHEARLQELVEREKVTHRAGRSWASAQAGVEAQGRIPIYYRLDGMVTHKGYIIEMVIDPEDESDVPEAIQNNITDDDTYSEYNDKYDTTTYLVSGGERLEEPFQQSKLERLEGGEYVNEDFSYQPAYVRQRDGDFPDF